MSTNESEHWTRISVPKVRSLKMSTLGQGSGKISTRDAAHGACVEHVKVEGFRRPVCILKGQNRDEIVAEAQSLGSTLILTRLGGVS
jgi:hypothetical protein